MLACSTSYFLSRQIKECKVNQLSARDGRYKSLSSLSTSDAEECYRNRRQPLKTKYITSSSTFNFLQRSLQVQTEKMPPRSILFNRHLSKLETPIVINKSRFNIILRLLSVSSTLDKQSQVIVTSSVSEYEHHIENDRFEVVSYQV